MLMVSSRWGLWIFRWGGEVGYDGEKKPLN